MGNTPTTMKEIADALGLNRSTVSLIINGHARERGLSEKTVARVRQYMNKVGYVPSRAAVTLCSGQQECIGILHTALFCGHLAVAFRQLVDFFPKGRFATEVVVCPESESLQGLREMAGRGVRRVIWVRTAGLTLSPELCAETLALGARMRPVIYNYGFDLSSDAEELLAHGFSLVGVSRLSCFKRMAGFLMELGHRRVLLPDLEKNLGMPQQEHLMVQTMRAKGLSPCFLPGGDSKFSPLVRVDARHLIERGRLIGSRVADALREGGGFTAVCFRDDEVAAGAMAELLRRGVKIPDDLTVVSMDGHPLGDVFPVPLTTLAIPVEAMVQKSGALASSNEDTASRRCRYRLLLRASHAAPRNGAC